MTDNEMQNQHYQMPNSYGVEVRQRKNQCWQRMWTLPEGSVASPGLSDSQRALTVGFTSHISGQCSGVGKGPRCAMVLRSHSDGTCPHPQH